jgi:hypothetical protein
MKVLLLVIAISILIMLVVFLSYGTKAPKKGFTLAPWGIYQEKVYPNYEFTHADSQFDYFFDSIGDAWKCKRPCAGQQAFISAG